MCNAVRRPSSTWRGTMIRSRVVASGSFRGTTSNPSVAMVMQLRYRLTSLALVTFLEGRVPCLNATINAHLVPPSPQGFDTFTTWPINLRAKLRHAFTPGRHTGSTGHHVIPQYMSRHKTPHVFTGDHVF
jgi:hypothetical protein